MTFQEWEEVRDSWKERERDEMEMMIVNADTQVLMPKRSKYRAWAEKFMAGDLPLPKYVRLRARLIKFHNQTN
jgi:hypothetical protein